MRNGAPNTFSKKGVPYGYRVKPLREILKNTKFTPWDVEIITGLGTSVISFWSNQGLNARPMWASISKVATLTGLHPMSFFVRVKNENYEDVVARATKETILSKKTPLKKETDRAIPFGWRIRPLKQICIYLLLTPRDLSRITGIGEATFVSWIEQGDNPSISLSTLTSIMTIFTNLNLSPRYLFVRVKREKYPQEKIQERLTAKRRSPPRKKEPEHQLDCDPLEVN